MSNLTPELNLNLAVDDDDTADYLTIALSDTLTVLDGLFNSATGHAHNGSHQGGSLEFLDLTVGEDLTVIGQTDLHGPALLRSNLHVMGITTLDGATTIATTLGVTGATTLAGLTASGLTVNGNAGVTGTLTVGVNIWTLDMSATRNVDIANNLAVHGAAQLVNTTVTNLTVGGTLTGGGVWNTGPYTTDWFRNNTIGQGIFNVPANQGIAFDATGPYSYPSSDRIILAAATQNLSNKGYINARDMGTSGAFAAPYNANDLTNYVFNYGPGVYTLPTPSAAWAGVFRCVKAWQGACTVNCASTVIGPGATGTGTSFVLANGDSATMWCDGTNWWVL